jgi:hypothetical protein
VKDLGMDELMERIQQRADHVDIGIHADAGQELVTIAAANEYGATIHHPGGTAYGYATEGDAAAHRVTFLKGGQGYKVLGVTAPHVITIPMRSFIRSTMDENAETYAQLAQTLLQRIFDGELDKWSALALMGQQIEADIKRKITTLKDPPNAPSTIKQKGSSNPLIDTGHLRASVRYVVKADDDTEPEVR